MDEILRLHLTKHKLIRINTCRLYLQITHLSDITESDGKTINKNFLTGPKPKYPRSIFKWPNQPFPSKQAWKMWNKYVRQVLNIQSNNTLAPYHILQQWITPLSQRQMIHEINVDVINNDIYIRMQEKIEWYHAHEQDHNSLQIIDVSKRETYFIPDTVIPAKRNKTGLIITYPKFKLNSKSHRQINTFQHYIESLPA